MPRISTLILLSLLCTPMWPQQKSHVPQPKHPEAKPAGDVSWSHEYDRFKGENHVGLLLCNISKAKPQLCLYVSTLWKSNQDSDRLIAYTDDFKSYTYLLFLDGQKHETSVMPQKSAILLLDRTQRIYLKGSPTCHSLSCDLFEIGTMAAMIPFVLSDLASAKSVEGIEDDVEFALTTKQLDAVQDFCITRHLPDQFGRAAQLHTQTANAVAKRIADGLNLRNAEVGTGMDKETLLNLTSGGVSVKRFQYGGVYSVDEMRWKDVTLEKIGQFSCGPLSTDMSQSECEVNHVYFPDGRTHDSNSILFMTNGLEVGGGGNLLKYIYYRMTFCGDPPNFLQNG